MKLEGNGEDTTRASKCNRSSWTVAKDDEESNAAHREKSGLGKSSPFGTHGMEKEWTRQTL